jgi:starch-binding outer membrane protein, SusD/RagB family
MKRSIKIIYSCLFITIFITSCSKDFLEEKQITALDTDYYTTQDGLDDLITGIYQSLRFHFNYEWAFCATNYGTDEFIVGGSPGRSYWNSYNSSLNSEEVYVTTIWDNMYGNINSCNIAIQNIPIYYNEGATTYNTRLGEAYFMRGFDYFKLVAQYGGVVLKLTPSTTVDAGFSRSTAQETCQQVLSDLKEAYNLLPETPEQTGRITKWAAAHYLAKVYLFRASELNDSWNKNTKETDLDSAIYYSEKVINESGARLADNFADIWNYTQVNGENEQLSEIILSAQFSDNTSTQGRFGNETHLYFLSSYQNHSGMKRDIASGREFQYLRTSDYAIDVYDRVNDSRFWKSFKTRYLCNYPEGAPSWTETYAPDPDSVGKPRFKGGEESILYIVNDAGDNRYTEKSINYRASHMYVRYFAGETQSYFPGHGNYAQNYWPSLNKYIDGSRASVASQFGRRDGIHARLAETYLIAAEAYGRKGDYNGALPFINAVRDRAAYKEEEDRSDYCDGGASWANNEVANTAEYCSYSDKNSYYESNNINPSVTSSTLDNMHLNGINDIFNSENDFYDILGATSDKDKFLHFILNERSRELMGEFKRWEDLARTKTLVLRTSKFNQEAKPEAPKSYLRPLPQTFLDLLSKNGKPLTTEEKEEVQNPGY